ncbi:hypothetical protein FB45DRAFT_1022454 [Roridomyces roridus]|uniref:Uncharacterized protein n=1 Tax=Roridomyces roridus TaxID=1738132 RepID=A0AAD7FTC1_9AGAR|nr:hypothetical protein FB45DRAFT_1022454 [Roridomyces roridus]
MSSSPPPLLVVPSDPAPSTPSTTQHHADVSLSSILHPPTVQRLSRCPPPPPPSPPESQPPKDTSSTVLKFPASVKTPDPKYTLNLKAQSSSPSLSPQAQAPHPVSCLTFKSSLSDLFDPSTSYAIGATENLNHLKEIVGYAMTKVREQDFVSFCHGLAENAVAHEQ